LREFFRMILFLCAALVLFDCASNPSTLTSDEMPPNIANATKNASEDVLVGVGRAKFDTVSQSRSVAADRAREQIVNSMVAIFKNFVLDFSVTSDAYLNAANEFNEYITAASKSIVSDAVIVREEQDNAGQWWCVMYMDKASVTKVINNAQAAGMRAKLDAAKQMDEAFAYEKKEESTSSLNPVVQPSQKAQTPVPVAQSAPTPQKYALVIGNGVYRNISRLANPVNDANDMAAALQSMGFVVDKLIDASQDQIDSAVTRLKNRLSVSTNSYGFFFYAGHGVQSNGENFLIPVDANIPGENYLRSRAVSMQVMLSELNDAGNELNMVVLDACRDNPFSWARSGSRGLSVIGNQPAKSIIVYATSAGQTAADGTGRNGLFTSQLLKNITTPGIDVSEIFRRTGADVISVSGGKQTPAVYSQFFGTAVLKDR